MNQSTRRTNIWLWFTAPIAVLLAVAAGGGLCISGLYRDAPSFAAQAKGQDLVSLAVVLPTLIISTVLAARGFLSARLVWLGALVYLVYTYLIASFEVRFNVFFLVYVALLGCSLYALIGGLVTTDMAGVKAGFREETPVRAVSIYLAVLAVLFYLVWLGEIVPALIVGNIPQSVQENGTPANAVHALDMAWILPSFGIAAAGLWRKQALGYTLAGALLSYCVLLLLAILSMVLFMLREGHPVAIPQAAIFGFIFAASLGMLIWYMNHLKSSPGSP